MHEMTIPVTIGIIKRCNQQFYWNTTFGSVVFGRLSKQYRFKLNMNNVCLPIISLLQSEFIIKTLCKSLKCKFEQVLQNYSIYISIFILYSGVFHRGPDMQYCIH